MLFPSWSLPLLFFFFFGKSFPAPLSGWYGRKPHFCRRSLPFDKPFLLFFPLDHQSMSSSRHHRESCACSSPMNALLVLLDRPLLFLVPFPFLLIILRSLNGLDCQTHSASSHIQKQISHHQRSFTRQSLHVWHIAPIRLYCCCV